MKTALVAFCLLALPFTASANMKEMTKYKAAHPDQKDSKCTVCHTTMGKKDLNDYGKKYLAAGKDFAKMEK